MNKTHLSHLLRTFGLLKFADYAQFLVHKRRNREKNRIFVEQNPNIALPPDYLLYESFGLDYAQYYDASRETAKRLIASWEKYLDLENASILDWGCGPARIVRHLPELLAEKNVTLYGTDYNAASIRWCNEHIPNVAFNRNQLVPPLPYPERTFEVIYGISIFTHLSETLHSLWFEELWRIAKPKGIMYLSTHGEATKIRLTESEKRHFDGGQLVIRGQTTNGHRTFTAYHPPSYVEHLFSLLPTTILEHREGQILNGKPQQDIWIVQKM